MKNLSFAALLVSMSCSFISSQAFAEAWNGANDPNNFNTDWHPVQYETHFSALPLTGSVPLAKTPWSDSYWPKNRGAFAYRWQNFQKSGQSPDLKPEELRDLFFNVHFYSKSEVSEMSDAQVSALSPLEKYSIYKGDFNYRMAREYLDPNNAWTAYWEGYCHAWAAAAANFPEPMPITVPVTIKRHTIMMSFGSGDIKALLIANYAAQNWDNDRRHSAMQLTSVGEICKDTQQFLFPGSKIKHGKEVMAEEADTEGLLDTDLEKAVDEYQVKLNRVDGTPIDRGLARRARRAAETDACRDVNAGALHIVMTNQLGLMHEAFLFDKTRDLEVWNQPAFKFDSKIVGEERPSRTSARSTAKVEIVESNLSYADDTDYGWTFYNPTLAGMFGLKSYFESFLTEYASYQKMLIEEGDITSPKQYPEHILDSSFYKYKLDLDSDGNIIGGDWITLNRPDDLYMVGKIGFSGDFAMLRDLYRPIQQ